MVDPRAMASRLLLRLIGAVNLFVFGIFTLLTLLAAVPLQLLFRPWDPDRRVSELCARWIWGVGMLRGQPFWRLVITGKERLGAGPWIVIANHQSMLDIPMMLTLPVPVRVGARPGVFRMPVFGHMAKFGGHIRLDPEAPEESLEACREALAKGRSVIVYPEGQRGDGVHLQKFQRGAFELAIRTGAPILPIAISGTGIALPKGSAWARARICRMHCQILEPMPLAGKSRRRLAAEAWDLLAAALTGPRPWEVVARVKERYRPAGRFRQGFAAGKVKHDPIFWMLAERLPKTGRLLDIGAGEGLLASYLRAYGSDLVVTGIDIDEQRIATARLVADDRMRFDVADGQDAPLPTADVVTCIDVLHYLPFERQDALVARMCAALAPGGHLYIRDPERSRGFAAWWTETWERVFVAIGRHRGEGVRVRGSAALAEVLRRHLVDVRVERAGTGPFANVLLSGRKPALPDSGPTPE